MKVEFWYATVEHRHGSDAYFGPTKEDVIAQLYDYVKDEWDAEIGTDFPKSVLPAKAVNMYFESEQLHDEYLTGPYKEQVEAVAVV